MLFEVPDMHWKQDIFSCIQKVPSNRHRWVLCRTDLAARLAELSVKMSSLRNAFESVQDLLDLAGLCLWQTELARIISTNLSAELRRCEIWTCQHTLPAMYA